jgi:hypothetical protein
VALRALLGVGRDRVTRVAISAAIQAHHSREARARALAERLHADIAWSITKGDVWDTHKRALLKCRPEAEWSLVVQDDAILAADFEQRLARLLAERGDDYALFCLFFRFKSEAKGFADYNAAGRAGYAQGGFAWPAMRSAVGTVVATRHVMDMVAYCDALDMEGDDPRISLWARARHLPIWYPLPSLVDHGPGTSLIGHGTNKGRVATWFAR